MTIQSYELVRTNIKETKQTTHDFDFKPFFAIQELGVPTTSSFCGGRTDASNDDGYSDFLSVGSSELHLIKDFYQLQNGKFSFSLLSLTWSGRQDRDLAEKEDFSEGKYFLIRNGIFLFSQPDINRN